MTNVFARLPQLTVAARAAFTRFPFAISIAIIGTLAAMSLDDYRDHKDLLGKISITCLVGLPLYIALTLVAESKPKFLCHFSATKLKWLLRTLGTGVLLLVFFGFAEKPEGWPAIRATILWVGSLFFVAVAPFTTHSDTHAFWRFNKAVFLRFCLAALYSTVLYLGIAVALTSIRHLFELRFSSSIYWDLWIFIVGIFNAWFFLAGMPSNLQETENPEDYSKGLRLFTQFTLIPLTILYLLILYAYEVKIIATWSLPKGWVSYLVIGFSFVGILSLMLVHPIKQNRKFGLIYQFARCYYVALLPLLVLLAIAIGRRVSDYGITEKRYVVMIGAVWLTFVAIHQILRRGQYIRAVPASFAVLTLIISVGPLSAGWISKRSQINRFEAIVHELKLAGPNKLIDSNKKEISLEAEKNLSSILNYLMKTHDLHAVNKWLPKNAQANSATELMTAMGLSYRTKYASVDTVNFYQSVGTPEVEIQGFDWLTKLNLSDYTKSKNYELSALDKRIRVRLNGQERSIVVTNSETQQQVEVDLSDVILRVLDTPEKNRYNMPSADLRIDVLDPAMPIRVYLTQFNGKRKPIDANQSKAEGIVLTNVSVTVLVAGISIDGEKL